MLPTVDWRPKMSTLMLQLLESAFSVPSMLKPAEFDGKYVIFGSKAALLGLFDAHIAHGAFSIEETGLDRFGHRYMVVLGPAISVKIQYAAYVLGLETETVQGSDGPYVRVYSDCPYKLRAIVEGLHTDKMIFYNVKNDLYVVCV